MEKKKRLKDFKKYFISHLDSLLPKIEEQVCEYENLSKEILSQKRKDLILGEALGASLIGFKNLPYKFQEKG